MKSQMFSCAAGDPNYVGCSVYVAGSPLSLLWIARMLPEVLGMIADVHIKSFTSSWSDCLLVALPGISIVRSVQAADDSHYI